MWMMLWGKVRIALENARKTACIDVDVVSENNGGFCAGTYPLVDRLLIGRHESNPRDNNYYKEA
jgi:hypothetical protein